MSDEEKGQRVRAFFDIEARALLEQYRIIETLLPHARNQGAAHTGEEGRYIESLLRAFLNRHLPGSLRAVSGFILCPSTKTGIQDLERLQNHYDRHSTQLDIIVYDFASYPVYEQYEEFCIVPPEGVIGIISVKKKLYNADIAGELSALRAAESLCHVTGRRGPFTALVAFSAQEADHDALNARIMSAIQQEHTGAAFTALVNEVSVLAETCVFKVRSNHSPPGSARYVGVDCRSETHVPMQRLLQSLLSVYHDSSRGSSNPRPGFVSFRARTFRDAPDLGLVPYVDV